jgi:hypothetical protein
VLGATTVPNPPPAAVAGISERSGELVGDQVGERRSVGNYGSARSLAFSGARSELIVLAASILLLAGLVLVGSTLQRRSRSE